MIQGVLSDADMKVGAFDLIAVTRGPGAFTGLRIGLAAARGLSLASNVPCFGITTTQAIAEAAEGLEETRTPLIVALDSKRADLYVQIFDLNGNHLCQPEAIAIEGLAQRIVDLNLSGPVQVVGDAAERALSVLPQNCVRCPAPEVPDAAFVAQVAERLYVPGERLCDVTPLYLRPPDAALPKNGGRLRP